MIPMDNERRGSGDPSLRAHLLRDQDHSFSTNDEGRSFLSVSAAGEDASTEAFEMAPGRRVGYAESQDQSEVRGGQSTDTTPLKVMTPAPAPTRCRNSARPWLAETLSFLIGIGALVAIIVLMARYNNNQLPQWPSGINLSAVVAALATLLRSMLMQAVEPSALFID